MMSLIEDLDFWAYCVFNSIRTEYNVPSPLLGEAPNILSDSSLLRMTLFENRWVQ